MLWNKARRVRGRSCQRHGKRLGQQPPPGKTWPTSPPRRSPRRPCSTWQPSRCFGTKRGGIAAGHSNDIVNASASDHRQVEPGLRE
nr:DUF1589 domain-containing protein [Rhodopirellula baltica]